jgi:hypothetical protein
MISDHVVGRLAVLVGAPVPWVGFVDVAPLMAIEPTLSYFAENRLAHGSRQTEEVCSDRQGIEYGFSLGSLLAMAGYFIRNPKG